MTFPNIPFTKRSLVMDFNFNLNTLATKSGLSFGC